MAARGSWRILDFCSQVLTLYYMVKHQGNMRARGQSSKGIMKDSVHMPPGINPILHGKAPR
jgi:hypothetical protein